MPEPFAFAGPDGAFTYEALVKLDVLPAAAPGLSMTILSMDGDLGERVFKLPFRRGNPIGIGGLVEVVNGPAFATAVGLVQYGAKASERVYRSAEVPAGGVIGRFKQYLSEFF